VQNLVWIRRDLFLERKFSERHCFPFQDADRVDKVSNISLKRVQWKEGRRTSFLRIQRKCQMAD
jgi:hypothetical protein